MLELISATVDIDDRIVVDAKLDGVPISFHLSQEAIEDRMGVTCTDLTECRLQLEENWGAFAVPLEELVHVAEEGMLITTQLLNP